MLEEQYLALLGDAAIIATECPVAPDNAVARSTWVVIFVENISYGTICFWSTGKFCNLFIGQNLATSNFSHYFKNSIGKCFCHTSAIIIPHFSHDHGV